MIYLVIIIIIEEFYLLWCNIYILERNVLISVAISSPKKKELLRLVVLYPFEFKLKAADLTNILRLRAE